MKILAIVQARMSSSRLPGKVIMPILDKPMLLHQIERIKQSKLISHLVVATSVDPSDDILAKTLEKYKVDYVRGSLDDVLDRFYHTVNKYNAKYIVRLTGDCPLLDCKVVDDVINLHISGDFDYSSNAHPPTFPDGLDVEVFNKNILYDAHKYAKLPSEREHVTAWMYNDKNKLKLGNLLSDNNNFNLRWTVDELEDFVFVSKIYGALYMKNNFFNSKDIMNFLEIKPDLVEINQGITRNEGMLKSLEKDRLVT